MTTSFLSLGHVEFDPASGPLHLLLISTAQGALCPDLLTPLPARKSPFHFLYRTYHYLSSNSLSSCLYVYLFIASLSQEEASFIRRSKFAVFTGPRKVTGTQQVLCTRSSNVRENERRKGSGVRVRAATITDLPTPRRRGLGDPGFTEYWPR